MFAASKGVGKPVSSQVFTANGTFVVPAGVTKINMSGFGSPAVGDTEDPDQVVVENFAIQAFASGLDNPPYAQWSTLYDGLFPAEAALSANVGVNLLTLPYIYFQVGTDDTYTSTSGTGDVWVSGSSFTLQALGSPEFSGDITYSSLSAPSAWQLVADGYSLGNDGAPADALGELFPGGTLTGSEPFRTAVPATTTTFNNVTVTPGASYPIFVPFGGSITISYFV
jgi:hypothetical protein